jgi:hypothetical protein
LPKHEKVEFDNNETEKTVSISLVNDKMVQNISGSMSRSKVYDELNEEHHGQQEEHIDLMFKIKLDKAEPKGVKISKKNICLVTIM